MADCSDNESGNDDDFGLSSASSSAFDFTLGRDVARLPNLLESAAEPQFELPAQFSQDLFNAALVSERFRARVTFPWQRGFAARVFGKASSLALPFCAPPLPPVHLSVALASASESIDSSSEAIVTVTKRARLGFAVRKLKLIDMVEIEDHLRLRALVRWRVIVESDLEASVVGRQLSELVTDLQADLVITSTIEDVFAKKSTATLLKRSGSVILYVKWTRKQGADRPLLFWKVWFTVTSPTSAG